MHHYSEIEGEEYVEQYNNYGEKEKEIKRENTEGGRDEDCNRESAEKEVSKGQELEENSRKEAQEIRSEEENRKNSGNSRWQEIQVGKEDSGEGVKPSEVEGTQEKEIERNIKEKDKIKKEEDKRIGKGYQAKWGIKSGYVITVSEEITQARKSQQRSNISKRGK